jgi:hypothetical protein
LTPLFVGSNPATPVHLQKILSNQLGKDFFVLKFAFIRLESGNGRLIFVFSRFGGLLVVSAKSLGVSGATLVVWVFE